MSGRSEQNEWLQRVLGVGGPSSSSVSTATESDDDQLQNALAGWTKVRTKAMGSLRALEGAIRGMNHPAGDKAIILVKAITANLTETPDTKNRIAELRKYLQTDRIIEEAEEPNGFGINVDLREPLLEALEEVEWALTDA
jgi:hypothetical protein